MKTGREYTYPGVSAWEKSRRGEGSGREGYAMSSPTRTPNVAGSEMQHEGRRVENIKQYYQQLCSNYRMISQQLQLPDLPPARRQTLSAQSSKLQQALQDFTDRVIRPIISANRMAGSSSMGNSPLTARVPPALGASSQFGMNTTPTSSSMPSQGTRAFTRAPPVQTTRGAEPRASSPRPASFDYARAPSTNTLRIADFLSQTQMSSATLLEKNPNSSNRNAPSFHGTAAGAAGETYTVQALASSISPKIRIAPDAEDFLLSLADRYISLACRGICESARHRKRPGISTKDLSIVLTNELGLATTAAGIPYAVPPAGPSKVPSKRNASFNPHYARMQQLKKHLSS